MYYYYGFVCGFCMGSFVIVLKIGIKNSPGEYGSAYRFCVNFYIYKEEESSNPFIFIILCLLSKFFLRAIF